MQRLAFLDGLRGWGAVIVVLYHVFCFGLPVDDAIAPSLNKIIIFNGPYAVFVFFLLSGFALSINFLATGNRRGLLKIASGRYVRLALPILAACTIVHLAMVAGLFSPSSERLAKWQNWHSFDPTIGHLLRFSLWDVFFNYQHASSYIGPLWTMSPELIGSCVLLVMIAWVPPNRSRPLILGMLGYVFLAFVPIDNVKMISLFFFGAVLADCCHRGWTDRIPSIVGLSMIAIGCGVPFFFVWRADFINVAGVIALTLGCLVVGPVRVWLSNPLSKFLGSLSFPLYLIHDPVIDLVGEPLIRNFGHGPGSRLSLDLLVVTISFMAAYLFMPVNRFALSSSRSIGDWAVARLFPHMVSPVHK